MLDVYLLASCVGYYRLSHVSQAEIHVLPGGYCFVAAALLTMLCRATLDRRTVWRAIGGPVDPARGAEVIACTTCDVVASPSLVGQPCPRCGGTLHDRKPDALARTAALLLAAFLLFFPANIYPMNVSTHLGQAKNYTVFAGVHALFDTGLWPLAVLVFCTSIAIPVGKIFVVAWCVVSAWRRSTTHLEAKTKMFRSVAELGRWSKTDPFAIVFFVPLIHFGVLGSQDAGPGATAFVMMSVLTMMAAAAFDPRLMWDAADLEQR
jgi:paraquat-inducible protein A